VHVHGANGHEAMDATTDAIEAMSKFYAAHGVTGFLPTTWTAPHDDIWRALILIKLLGGVPGLHAKVLGAHVEGPYISPKYPGAQNAGMIRPADRTEAESLLETGIVRLMALAPEIEANHWLIDACVQRGITVSAGHTDATLADMEAAAARGLSQTTHTFNAMRGLHHREPGTVGAALMLPGLRCEVIADGIHVHPLMVKLLYDVRGPDGVLLITDAVRGAGLPLGTTYQQDGRTVTISETGARLEDGTLAGSLLTMDAALRNLIAFTGAPLEDAWRCASLTPATVIEENHHKGSIAVGKDADLVLLDADLRVVRTIVKGRTVFVAGGEDA
jgi:N-acetylglucosamine-6-phosphate deacetylase